MVILIQGDYKGNRLDWQPSSDIFGYQIPIWTHLNSFSFLPLNINSSKTTNRIRSLCTSIFHKNILQTPDLNSINNCISICKQIIMHNMQTSKTILFPMLFAEKSIVANKIVGFNGLYEILTSPNREENSNQHQELLAIELQKALSININHCFKNISQVSYTINSIPFYPKNYFPSYYDFTTLEYIKSSIFASSKNKILEGQDKDNYLIIKHHNNTINDSISRIINFSNPFDSILQIYKLKKYSETRVNETTNKWCSDSGLPIIDCEYNEQLPPSPSLFGGEYKDRIQIELTISILKCLHICIPNNFWNLLNDSSLFFGHLLLHPDPNISKYTASLLQWIIIKYPEHRVKLINALIQFTYRYTEITTTGIETLLSNIIYLISIWVSLNQTTKKSTNLSLKLIEITFLRNVESLALINFCSSSSFVRYLSLQLIHCIYSLFPYNTKCCSSLLYNNEKNIIEISRFLYLKFISFENTSKVKINVNSIVLNIETISLGNNFILWSKILSEIFKLLINQYDDYQLSINEARNIIFTKKLPFINNKIDENINFYSDILVNRLYYHLFMLSTNDCSLSNNLTNFKSFKDSYLYSNYFNILQNENDFILDELFINICSIHQSMIYEILDNLYKYYKDFGKKTKLKVHVSFTRLISIICSSNSFYNSIKFGDISCCEIIKQIIDELSNNLDLFSSSSSSFIIYLFYYLLYTNNK